MGFARFSFVFRSIQQEVVAKLGEVAAQNIWELRGRKPQATNRT